MCIIFPRFENCDAILHLVVNLNTYILLVYVQNGVVWGHNQRGEKETHTSNSTHPYFD